MVNTRVLLVTASCALALPAFAEAVFVPERGDASGNYVFMPSNRTDRTVEQTRAELAAWQRNPVTADGLRQVGGEVGWIYVGTAASEKTRAQVLQELAEFRRNPVTADGWTLKPGELGWVFVGTAPTRATPADAVTSAQRRLR